VDHPVAILPIACRRPSTLPLTFNPGPFGLLRGFSRRAWARDARPALRFPRFQLCAAAAGGPYPIFPVRAYRRNRAVSQITDSGLCHSCYHIAVGRIGTCQTKASRKSAQSTRPRAASGRSISPREFIFQCVFGNVSSQLKQSRRPPAIMRRSDSSSRERRSVISCEMRGFGW
jgi:hypothetical protein